MNTLLNTSDWLTWSAFTDRNRYYVRCHCAQDADIQSAFNRQYHDGLNVQHSVTEKLTARLDQFEAIYADSAPDTVYLLTAGTGIEVATTQINQAPCIAVTVFQAGDGQHIEDWYLTIGADGTVAGNIDSVINAVIATGENPGKRSGY